MINLGYFSLIFRSSLISLGWYPALSESSIRICGSFDKQAPPTPGDGTQELRQSGSCAGGSSLVSSPHSHPQEETFRQSHQEGPKSGASGFPSAL